MRDLWLDIRYALRRLRRDPTFAAVALLTLAFGIGANTAAFSIVEAVLLRPLPLPHSDDIVQLFCNSEKEAISRNPSSYLDFTEWRERSGSFQALAAYRSANGSLRTARGPERVTMVRAAGTLFPALGLEPVLGRLFDQSAEQPGQDHVAVISDGMWRTRFGSDPAILGRNIVVDDNSYQVIGVVRLDAFPPEVMSPPTRPDIWVPLVPSTAERSRGFYFLRIFGRLKPGVSRATAAAEMNILNAQIEASNPLTHHGWTIELQPLKEVLVGDVRAPVIVIFGAVGCVLLMTCVNVANLLLARTVNRRTELAVRAALGASSTRILRQLAAESLCLSFAGGVLGVLAAFAAQRALARAVSSFLPRSGELRLDATALLFALAVSCAAGLIFGLTPVVHSRRVSLMDSLRQRSGSLSSGAAWMLRALVVTQTALALLLLLAAGFMVRSFSRLTRTSAGFVPEHLLATQVELSPSRYPKPDDQALFFRRALEKAREIPGFTSVAVVTRLPFAGGLQTTSYQTEAHPMPPDQWPQADARLAFPGYFSTLQIPLLRGRDFTDDDRRDTPPVIVINRAAAARLWPGEEAVGKRMQIFPDKVFRVVVGIVGDVKLHGLEHDATPTLYVPYDQSPFPAAARSGEIVIRTGLPPESVAASLKRALATLDDGQSMGPLRVVVDQMENSIGLRRFSTLLTTSFAGIAGALSLLGAYGVMSFAVTMRRQEIGIRSALGAGPSRLLWWVLREGMLLAGCGVLVGLLLSAATRHALDHVLYAVSTSDPGMYLAGAVALIGACTAACYLPARRAAATDPLLATRSAE